MKDSSPLYTKKINQLRDKVVNFALITFASLGFIAWLLILLSSYKQGFSKLTELFIHSAAVTILILITIFRKKLKLNIKIWVLVALIVFTTVANLQGFGLFANTKIFIAVFPVFLSFLLPLRKTILALCLLLLIYCFIGYLFITGQLTYDFDLENYATQISSWIIGFIVIIYVSVGLLSVGHYFSKALISNYTVIEKQHNDLGEKEEKYRLLYETSNDAIVIIKNKQYIDCNKKTFTLFKCEKDFILQKPPWEFSPELQPDGETSRKKAERIFSLAERGEAQVFDWQHIRPNGEVFDVSISLNPLRIANTFYVQAVLRDITEKKLTDAELEQYRKKLEALVDERTKELASANNELESINEELTQTNDELLTQQQQLELTLNHLRETQKQLIQSEKMASIGILTSGIAHEINNPVNFISSGLAGLEIEINEVIEVLEKCRKEKQGASQKDGTTPGKEDNQDDVKEAIENIPQLFSSMREGVERTTSIVKGLRIFSRIDSEEKLPAQLNEIIQSTLTILRNKYKNRIEIKTSLVAEDGLLCFPGKLSQLILNLIHNAIDAIEEKGTIEITTRSLHNNAQFELSIKDTGSGIPAEYIEKIFDPFFTTKPVGKGSGLGLSISHGIVNDHGGKIRVQSEPGKGSTFTVILPKQ